VCLDSLGRFEEGEKLAQQLVQEAGWEGESLQFLAIFARKMGEIDQSIIYQRQALGYGINAAGYSNYLMNLIYGSDVEPVFLLNEHQKINQFFDVETVTLKSDRNQASPRKIGFISPDFRTHVVAFFVENLFEHLDHSRYQLFAYSACPPHQCDAMTQKLKNSVEGWQDIYALSGQTAAQKIADDGIDILIDLCGHTGDNRLDVLACKPAPVIATWLGYLSTTGLEAVDFRLVDAYTDPVGLTETHHSEQLMRLGHTQWCYVPRPEYPAVNPLPAQSRELITFGSCNNFFKISDETLALWADLMAQVPNSHLLVSAIPEGRARKRVVDIFMGKKISPARLEFLGRTGPVEYMQNYHRVDIALDSFPYNGGTTTCDALYMGVPVLTLAGQRSVARSGVSLMSNVGLPEWVAHSPQEFLDIGARMAADVAGLARLRAGLRERFMASPLGDQTLFARDFEQALEAMWRIKGRTH